MKALKKLEIILIIFVITAALARVASAQEMTKNIETFFDSKIPGIRVQVNATKEAQPTQNITVMLSLTGETDAQVEVEVSSFNLNAYGFIHGKDKVSIGNISDTNFALPQSYAGEFPVPENVSGSTYGEFTITYNVTYPVGAGYLKLPYNLTIGFTMTNIENVYLETIEEKLQNLTTIFEQLNQTFWESFQKNLTNENLADLNRTYWELLQNYTKLQGNIGELDNTRRLAVALGITTVFFLATTAFLVLRKPKQYW